MRYRNNRFPLTLQCQQKINHQIARLLIERSSRLIEQPKLLIELSQHSQHQTLPLTSRELGHAPLQQFLIQSEKCHIVP